jgi:DNA replication and repair protein RecF
VPDSSPGNASNSGAVGRAGARSPVTRGIKVNGLPTRATGLVGQLPVVYFSPVDVELAGGPPAGRRQYLNLANSQVSADHLRALQRYNRVLLQRNQVLRLVRERRQPPSALEPWTEQMLDWGARILHQRLAMLRDVNPRLARIYADLAGTHETLRVVYRSTAFGPDADGIAYAAGPSGAAKSAIVGDDLTAEALRASFRARQSLLATRETDQSVSLVGPQRDDFTFMLDDVDLNTYGSRGQQRLAVLALKLAEADWMRSAIGELPVVLLDDVLSELDPQRRAYVLHRVAEPEPTHQRQVWITTTESDPSPVLEQLRSAQRFVIDGGQVRTA